MCNTLGDDEGCEEKHGKVQVVGWPGQGPGVSFHGALGNPSEETVLEHKPGRRRRWSHGGFWSQSLLAASCSHRRAGVPDVRLRAVSHGGAGRGGDPSSLGQTVPCGLGFLITWRVVFRGPLRGTQRARQRPRCLWRQPESCSSSPCIRSRGSDQIPWAHAAGAGKPDAWGDTAGIWRRSLETPRRCLRNTLRPSNHHGDPDKTVTASQAQVAEVEVRTGGHLGNAFSGN